MTARRIAHYEIQDKIGQGGMGEVYRARDTRLERDVAIKLLPQEFTEDAERLARFRREAKLLGALQHQNIASIYGLEEVDGQLALAMELVEGEDLAQRLRRGPVPLEDALHIARQLAEGLESAHESGIVHRDLKPANLKLTPDDRLKILDFGLARAYMDDPSSADLHESPTITAALTHANVLLGTAAYMSPEQARGRGIDQRADIWAFGVIVFEMLTGKRLFEGDTVSDTVAAVLRADISYDELPSDTPRGVVRLLERCLERDARRRLRDIGEARVRLERWREQPESIHESHSILDAPVETEARWRRLVPWIVAGAGFALSALLLFLPREGDRPAIPLTTFEIDVPTEANIPRGARLNVLLSPDGRRYGWITPEGLHLRSSDSREAQLLPETEGLDAACFSPDSRWIAFMARGELLRIGVSGGSPFKICDIGANPRGMTWVDEDTIVLSSAINVGLSAVDVGSGAVRTLTEVDTDAGERSHRWPSRVPGGEGVLYECQMLGRDYDQSDVRYVSLDGSSSHTVHAGGAGPMALASGALVFARGSTVFAAPLDLGSMRLKGLPIAVLESVDGSTGNQEDDDGSVQYAVDRNGTLLYMTLEDDDNEDVQLAWLDLETDQVEPFGVERGYREVHISPNGQLAIVSTVDQRGSSDLYVHDLTEHTEQLLTPGDGVEYLGAWSPDSQMYYWSQGSADGSQFEVWRRRVDSAAPAEFVIGLPQQGGGWANSISPDGRYLMCEVFTAKTQGDLHYTDLTEDPLELIPYLVEAGNERLAQFMGDGDYVVYNSDPMGASRSEMFIRRFPDDGSIWSLPAVDGTLLGYKPIPAAGGVYVGADWYTYRIPIRIEESTLRVGARELLFDTREVGSGNSVLPGDWHPDGRRAVVRLRPAGIHPESSSSLAVILGWEESVMEMLAQEY